MRTQFLKTTAIGLLSFAALTAAAATSIPQRTPTPVSSSSDASQAVSTPISQKGNRQDTAYSNTPWLAPFIPAANTFFELDQEAECAEFNTNSTTELHGLDLRSDEGAAAALARRQSCAKGYSPCRAAGYCCADNTICQTDYDGQVACCPQGAACTGIVPTSSRPTQQTQTGYANGGFVATTQGAQYGAGAGSNGGQVVAGGSTVAFIAGTAGAGQIVPGGFVAEMLLWLL